MEVYISEFGNFVVDENGKVYDTPSVLEAFLKQRTFEFATDANDNLVIGDAVIEPKFDSIYEEAEQVTCFGSLAYCCHPSRKCSKRDQALKIFNIDHDEFMELKSQFNNRIIEYAKTKNKEGSKH